MFYCVNNANKLDHNTIYNAKTTIHYGTILLTLAVIKFCVMVQNKNQGQQQDPRQQNQADSRLKGKNQESQQEEPRDTSRKGDKNTLGRKDTTQGKKQ